MLQGTICSFERKSVWRDHHGLPGIGSVIMRLTRKLKLRTTRTTLVRTWSTAEVIISFGISSGITGQDGPLLGRSRRPDRCLREFGIAGYTKNSHRSVLQFYGSSAGGIRTISTQQTRGTQQPSRRFPLENVPYPSAHASRVRPGPRSNAWRSQQAWTFSPLPDRRLHFTTEG